MIFAQVAITPVLEAMCRLIPERRPNDVDVEAIVVRQAWVGLSELAAQVAAKRPGSVVS